MKLCNKHSHHTWQNWSNKAVKMQEIKCIGITDFFLSENSEFSTIQALPVLFCSTEKEAPCAPETLLVYSTAFWPTLAALVKHANTLPGTGQQNGRYLQCRGIWPPHGLIISHFARKHATLEFHTDARLRFAFTTDNLFCHTLLLLLWTSAILLAVPTANRAARLCSTPWGGGRYHFTPDHTNRAPDSGLMQTSLSFPLLPYQHHKTTSNLAQLFIPVKMYRMTACRLL